jgi:multiple sugar transport system permease protein
MRQLELYRANRVISQGAVILFILVALIFFLLPIAWIGTMAFKRYLDIFAIPPKWINFEPTLEGFRVAFRTRPVMRWMINSLLISSGSTILSLMLGVPAAYCFARGRFRGKRMAWSLILLTRVLPPIVLVIPFRMLMLRIGLFGSHLAVILYSTTFNAAFAAWIMSGFFEGIPVDIENCARIDGCGPIRTFWYIAVPLAKPGIVTVALFAFIFSWNDFLGALTLTNTYTATLPIGIMGAVGQMSVQWNVIGAISLITILPVMILAVALQRYYVSGLTLGAIK